MTAVDILTAQKIVRPADVLDATRKVGLEDAAGPALMQMESFGGLNVFGNDRVPNGGAYVPGGAVTETTYRAYAAWRDAVPQGKGRCNGVGPGQLTSIDYQLQADRMGGCWRWEVNLAVSLGVLKAHLDRFGNLRDAFVAYNGGAGAVTGRAKKRNDAAELYGDKAIAKVQALRALLGTSPTPSQPWLALPTLTYGDEGPAVTALQTWCNGHPWKPALRLIPVTGLFGDITADVLTRAQAQLGITGSNGRDFGPRSKQQFWLRGFRGA